MILTRSPEYRKDSGLMRKWRLSYEGGEDYLRQYVLKMSKREDDDDYGLRLALSYNPNVCGAAITKIKNALYQRMVSVERKNGVPSYQNAVGTDVTRKMQSMNAFIGNSVLPEMLAMRRVGVFVDMPRLKSGLLGEKLQPYLYLYKTEDILATGRNSYGELTSALLRSSYIVRDEFGLNGGVVEKQLLFRLVANEHGQRAVEVQHHTKNTSGYAEPGNTPADKIEYLDIPMIPFVIFEIDQSLLHDIADHQMALVNLASSDMSIAMRGNFPLYTEQYDAKAEAARANLIATFVDANGNTIKEEKKKDKIGVLHGKRYPINTDRPDFIAPPSEPLQVSMEKQVAIKKEVDELVNLTLADMSETDNSPESGLAHLASVLESGERVIAKLWAMYETQHVPNLVISYPRTYTLKTDETIRSEAKELREFLPEIPIKSFQKVLLKDILKLMYGHKSSASQMEAWYREIDALTVIKTDPKAIREDHEAGLVSDEMASTLMGYPAGEAIKASADHAARMAATAIAQSKIEARGTDIADPKAGKIDKENDNNFNKDQRGEGKDGTNTEES
jgi:hypothetical protein